MFIIHAFTYNASSSNKKSPKSEPQVIVRAALPAFRSKYVSKMIYDTTPKIDSRMEDEETINKSKICLLND